MSKRIKSQGIRVHRQYTYEQAADVMGISAATVRRWRSEGLEVFDGKVPHLIVGAVLKEFVGQKNAKTGPKMPSDNFLCMTCGAHRGAYGGMADYWPKTDKTGYLKTLCDVCEGPCSKLASKAKLNELGKTLTIVIRDSVVT